jgi:hypothetical protein
MQRAPEHERFSLNPVLRSPQLHLRRRSAESNTRAKKKKEEEAKNNTRAAAGGAQCFQRTRNSFSHILARSPTSLPEAPPLDACSRVASEGGRAGWFGLGAHRVV